MANKSYEKSPEYKLLLYGIDTIECAYLLKPSTTTCLGSILEPLKEEARLLETREEKIIYLGGVRFLLSPRGTNSGYPYRFRNSEYEIQFGPTNRPSFFVTFSSEALWHYGALELHQSFLQLACHLGYEVDKPEIISRADPAFDYDMPEVNFGRKDFLSKCTKGELHWKGDNDQTISLGTSPIRLRVYDKVEEILHKSDKVWFFDMWGQNKNVWRIEFQARKETLKDFGIYTFEDLFKFMPDMLHYLTHKHTTLRIKSSDSNKSRRPLHPLWIELQTFIDTLPQHGVLRYRDKEVVIEHSLKIIAKGIYGWLKRFAALLAIKQGKPFLTMSEAIYGLAIEMKEIHEQETWKQIAMKKIAEIKAGKWK